MKKITGHFALILLLMLLIFAACLEPYDSPVTEMPNNYLVVEGIISNGETTFKLTRTSSLDANVPLYENNARVWVENESGSSVFTLFETDSGNYTANLDLNLNEQYRVKIYTTEEKEYVSEFVPVRTTPEIDSVTWSAVNNGVQFYVTTHDPQSQTLYYRWTFEETWQYRTPFYSTLKYENGEVVPRNLATEQIYNCWQSDASTNILVASSVKLGEDVIYKQPLIYIFPEVSSKLDVKYSILVKQYALTQEAFEFWDLLKKNSENLGTLFDPQPSQLPGNITCTTDPNEPVVGFVSAGSVTEKRIFVQRRDIPFSIRNRFTECEEDTVPNLPEKIYDAFAFGDSVPIYSLIDGSYVSSSRFCVDCTSRGGMNFPPDFWE